jgi:hypothetical protein
MVCDTSPNNLCNLYEPLLLPEPMAQTRALDNSRPKHEHGGSEKIEPCVLSARIEQQDRPR